MDEDAAPVEETEDRIIVTGTRIPTPLDQVGRSITVVTAAEIEQRQQRFVYDVLTAVPGLQVTRSGSFGALSSVSVRGLASDQTLVVQDGIVLNNPGSFGTPFNFANFDTSDVERIEVIRGAQSTLYGSDAIGGIINIVTKDGSEGLGGSGYLEAGSFGTFRGAATLRGGSETVSGRVTLAGTTTDGFSTADEANGNREDDGFRNVTLSAKGRYQPLEILSFDAVFRFQDSENEFDSFAFGIGPVDGDEIGETEEVTAGGFATLDTFGGRLKNRLSITYARNEQINLTDGAVSFDSTGTRLSYEYQGTAQLFDGLTAVFGAEYERQEAVTRTGFGGNQEIFQTSGYGLFQIQPLDGVSLTAGVRYDTSEDFGSATTVSGAGAIRIPLIDATLRGSYSEGFRAPSAGELGFNPDLQAEVSNGWDIGLERDFWRGRAQASVTWFDQRVEDLIAFDLAAFTFINVQTFETSGLEVAAAISPIEALTLDVSYTYLDAFNVSTTLAAGNQPDHRFNAEITLRPTAQWTLSAGIYFNGREPDGAAALDSFTLLSLRASYALSENADLFARLENATDANYQDNAGFGTAPLNVAGGMRVRF